MAKAMGMEDAKEPMDFIAMLEKLLQDCGVADLKMSDYGITPDEFPKMADNAMGPMGGLFVCDRVQLRNLINNGYERRGGELSISTLSSPTV